MLIVLRRVPSPWEGAGVGFAQVKSRVAGPTFHELVAVSA